MRQILGGWRHRRLQKVPQRAMPTVVLKALRPVGPLVGKIMGPAAQSGRADRLNRRRHLLDRRDQGKDRTGLAP